MNNTNLDYRKNSLSTSFNDFAEEMKAEQIESEMTYLKAVVKTGKREVSIFDL